ncbi:hypothetical protein PHMEG_00027211, partial [Phytophthora megakarya]
LPEENDANLHCPDDKFSCRSQSTATKNAAKTGHSPVLFDEALVHYTKTYMCTHSGSFKPRGSGRWTNHAVRSIGCKAKLNAVLSCTEDGEYSVHVSSHKRTHNHPVTADVFYTYAETRKVTSPTTLDTVKTMWKGGSKKKKLLRYLRDVSGKPSVIPLEAIPSRWSIVDEDTDDMDFKPSGGYVV